MVGVALARRGRLLDPLIHRGLRVGRLVAFVVTPAPVAYDIDHHVAVELVAIQHREPRRGEARLHVVRIDVDDRRIEAFGEVARVVGGASFLRIGGEAELVVADQVDRATRRVAFEPGEVERLRHDALRGERRDRKSTRLNSSHGYISYAVFCLKKKKKKINTKNRELYITNHT